MLQLNDFTLTCRRNFSTFVKKCYPILEYHSVIRAYFNISIQIFLAMF